MQPAMFIELVMYIISYHKTVLSQQQTDSWENIS